MYRRTANFKSAFRCAFLWLVFAAAAFAQIGVFGGSQGGMNATHSGLGTPAASLGVNGDLYIDVTPGAPKLYGPKANGQWPPGIALGGSGSTICSAASASALGCLIVPPNSGLTVDANGNLSVTKGAFLGDPGSNGLLTRTAAGITTIAMASDLPAGYSYTNLANTPTLGSAAALSASSLLSDSGANGLVKRTGQGTTAVAGAADLPTGYPYTNLSNAPTLGSAAGMSASSLLSDSGANGLVKRTGQGTTAVAGAADLPTGYPYTNLSNAPTLGSAAALSASSLLSDSGANGLIKRTAQGTTALAGAADLPAGYSYANLSSAPTDLGQFANNQVGYLAGGTATAQSSLLSISKGTLMTDYSDPAMATFNIGIHSPTAKLTNAVLIGDSWTEGAGFTNFRNVWAQQVQAYLQTNFGGHGTGIIQLHTSTGAWTLTGTWNPLTNLGPSQAGASAFSSLYQASGTGNTAAMTIKYYGDHLVVYYATYTDSGAGFSVAIDGGLPATYGNATSTVFTPNTAVIPVAIGWHTAVITAPATGNCYLYGAEWISGTTGVSVHNLGHGGARSEAFGSNAATELTFLKQIAGGVQLAIISLGVNDYGTSIPPATYQANLQAIITYLQTNFSPMPSILILDQGNVNETGASPQSAYTAIEQQLALANNAMFLSVSRRWGSFANASALGIMYTDGIHPDDAGHLDIASMIERRIIESNTPFVQSYASLSEVVGNPTHNIGNETSTVGVGPGALGTGNYNSVGYNTGVGEYACNNLTSGHNNTCVGQYAGGTGPTTGLFDTLIGSNAQAGNGSSYVVQLGGGTNTINNTAQYMTWNFLDSAGYMSARLIKLGAGSISTAANVTITYGLTHLTGTIPVSTITPPPIYVSGGSFTGCVRIIANDGFSTTTTGNIGAVYTLAAGSLHAACYDGTTWYIQ